MTNILFIKPSGLDKTTPETLHPLGLMSLAAYLRHVGRRDELQILDTRIHLDDTVERNLDRAVFVPDIVGLSALTIEARSMSTYARAARARWPHATIVCGGPHASSYPHELVRETDVDVAVQGEGEITFADLVRSLELGRPLDEVKGITFLRDGVSIETPPRDFIQDLDALPWPAWDLVDIEAYASMRCMSTLPMRRYMTIFTSRACPYRCNYCHDVFGKVFRARSPENVVAEIEEIGRRYGITEFECVDDIFNIDNRRAERICDEIIARGLEIGITFPNGLRADRLPRPLLEKLRRAGTRSISFAVETASERLQRATQKKMNLERLAQAVRDANDLGILCTGFFMLGFPGETREELDRTVDFALSIPLHTAHFFIVTPFQGTALAAEYPETVRRHAASLDGYNYVRGNTNLSAVSDRELFRTQRLAWLRFYLRPSRILQILRHYPQKRDLMAKAARLLTYKIIRNRRDDRLPALAPT